MTRVILFAPLPPRRLSPAADYAQALLPALAAAGLRPILVEERAEEAPRPVPGAAAVIGLAEYRRSPLLHALPHVCELADHPDHAGAWRAALEVPGLVALHDLALHRLVEGMTLARGGARAYEAAMAAAHGPAGRRLARLRQEGFWSAGQAARLPLAQPVLDAARAVLVHSHHAARRLRAMGVTVPIAVAPRHAPAPPATAPDRAAARARLGLTDGDAVLLAPAEAGARALRVLAALRDAGTEALLLVPVEGVDPDLPARAAEAGLGARLRLLDPGTDPALPLRAADLLLDLRLGDGGDLAPLAAALAAGLPAIAWDLGPAGEYPAEILRRIPFAAGAEAAAVAPAAAALLADRAAAAAMADRARAHLRAHCTPRHTAAVYRRLLARL